MSAPGKKQRASRRGRTALALVLVGLVVCAAGGYLALIRPERQAAARLDGRIAAVEAKIAEYRAASPAKPAAAAVRAAELLALAKAMPDSTDMSGIMLELDEVASASGIAFDSITPQAAVAQKGYEAVPISLVVKGNFYDLSDFLFRLRNLVAVRDGRLATRGRLFTVDSFSFGKDEDREFPYVKADLTVDAFVFERAPGAGAADATAASEETTSDEGSTSAAPSEPNATTSTTSGAEAAAGR